MLVVADASALPRLRRALSPESIELVGTASTPQSALAQLRRVYPDVVVVDLSLSQTDVYVLIAQLAQERAAPVLALASGEETTSLAERARAAGAAEVVERRGVGASWHEETGSPHVLSLRVLTLAASGRPRSSNTSMRVSRLSVDAISSVPVSRVPPTAAGASKPTAPSGAMSPAPGPHQAPLVSKSPAPGPLASKSPAPGSLTSKSPAPGSLTSKSPAPAPRPEALTSKSPAPLPTPMMSKSPGPLVSKSPAPQRTTLITRARTPAPLTAAPAGQLDQPPSAAKISKAPGLTVSSASASHKTSQSVQLVAIGASTGGTQALTELLRTLPVGSPPMLVVQHMLPEFTRDFVERLDEACELHVRVAVDGEPISQGSVLVAPGGRHLRVTRDHERRLRARVSDEPPVGKHRPSVDVLFQACAEVMGSAALGVLLTGMGDDGARGLLALHNAGARTLVQDQASSVCFGMPSSAIALGAAQQILPLPDIAHALRELAPKARSSGHG